MSKRADYCKRLLLKAIIIESNIGENERKEVSKYIDDLSNLRDEGSFLVDDVNGCECKDKIDVIKFNDNIYCCDCLHIIKEIKNGKETDTIKEVYEEGYTPSMDNIKTRIDEE